MSSLLFYREQAAQQQAAADAATLENVRERCQRASDAWLALAAKSELAENGRRQIALDRLNQLAENQGSVPIEVKTPGYSA